MEESENEGIKIKVEKQPKREPEKDLKYYVEENGKEMKKPIKKGVK